MLNKFPLLLTLLLTACAVNPATGRQELNLLSAQEEQAIGQQAVAQTVKAGGGLYDEKPALRTYLNARLRDLGNVSEIPEAPKLHLVDSPVFNAMATPGHVMVFRGILPYFNNEAEMMAVLGHELGHVTARHIARSVTNAKLAELGLNIGLAVLGQQAQLSPQGMQLAGQMGVEGAKLSLAKFGRDNELEADGLGIRYLSRLCYNPAAAASMQDTLLQQDMLMENMFSIAGMNVPDSFYHRLMRSHPESQERIAANNRMASQATHCGDMLHTDRYLDAIDGLAFGPQVKTAGVKGSGRFIHPIYRFAFNLPDDWFFPGLDGLPFAINSKTGAVMSVSALPIPTDQSAEEYLLYKMPNLKDASRVEGVSGYDVMTGTQTLPDGQRPFGQNNDTGRTIAFKSSNHAGNSYLILVTIWAPQELQQQVEGDVFTVAASLKKLTAAQAQKVQPLRIQVHTVKRGETVESLAAKLPFGGFNKEQFQLLNGLNPGETLRPEQRVKMIVNPNERLGF